MRQVSPKTIWLFRIVKILTAVAFVLCIFSEIFKFSGDGTIACIFFVFLIVSAIIGRSIKFYCRQTSWLGFVTEMTFIVGVILLLFNLLLESNFAFVGFFIFSFVLSPMLGITNRIIRFKRREVKSVGRTIAEMIILSAPVIIVIWALLRFGF